MGGDRPEFGAERVGPHGNVGPFVSGAATFRSFLKQAGDGMPYAKIHVDLTYLRWGGGDGKAVSLVPFCHRDELAKGVPFLPCIP